MGLRLPFLLSTEAQVSWCTAQGGEEYVDLLFRFLVRVPDMPYLNLTKADVDGMDDETANALWDKLQQLKESARK